jgi:hypothetical protein
MPLQDRELAREKEREGGRQGGREGGRVAGRVAGREGHVKFVRGIKGGKNLGLGHLSQGRGGKGKGRREEWFRMAPACQGRYRRRTFRFARMT